MLKKIFGLLLCVCMLFTGGGSIMAQTLKAVDYDEGTTKKVNERVEGIDAKKYFMFKDVNFSSEVKSVIVNAGVSYAYHSDSDILEFRLDSVTGKVIGRCLLRPTGGKETVKPFQASLDLAGNSGTHDLYVVSLIGRQNTVSIESIELSSDAFVAEKYEPVPEDNLIDAYYDTIYAVNDVKQALPDYEEVGELRDDKFVAMFYWTWHEGKAGSGITNLNEFDKEHPDARNDYNHPAWPTSSTYYWNEPLFDYYRTSDAWVLRRHAQMLAAAGVDVIVFDITNGAFTWREGYMPLLEEFRKAREDGIKTPQVAFMSNFGATDNSLNALQNLYLSIYKDGYYSDLWFNWKGKPLIMAYPQTLDKATDPDTQQINNEIKEFFTFREPQPSYTGGPKNNNQWGWLEAYPQNEYVKTDNGCEMVTVGIAQNHSMETGKICAMNTPYVMGRNYTDAYGFDYSEGAYKYNYNFQEQWDRAIELDPECVFVTGWNEWTAGRQKEWSGLENSFPDQFNNPNSRDIEPTKGELLDTTYYQLVANVRRFKGARPVATASGNKTISIDGQFDEWIDVSPEFRNAKGTTFARNSLGADNKTTYTNNTGRNNIVVSKAAKDNDNLYFYVETADVLTPSTDKNWMVLYINTDRNYATGWEGFDYAINRSGAGSLEKNSAGTVTGWEAVEQTVEWKAEGNRLEIKLPKVLLAVNEPIDIEFKWADNIEDNDIMNFWVNGNTAPLGRAAYRYTEIEQKAFDAATRATLKDSFAISADRNYGYVNGGKTYLVDANNRITSFQENGDIYVPLSFIGKAFNGKVEYEQDKNAVIIKTREKTLRMVVDGEARLEGRLIKLDNSAKVANGIAYVPAKAVAEVFDYGMNQLKDGGILVFGKALDLSPLSAYETAF